ncbi:MAG TPA: HAD family phosphatase [Patescibacteria group bacterium]|nr:HAD family phosphatase [Patescibacteria group bacterium]
MAKAFILDMDGVIVNSEIIWEKYEEIFLSGLLGKNIYEKIKGDLLGSTAKVIYGLAKKNGLVMEKDEFFKSYDRQAVSVYKESELTKDIEKLIEKLVSMEFNIGLVTSSRRLWIDQVIPRLKNRNSFKYILSIGDRDDLESKPSPAGYIEAMKKLNSSPAKTIILEDSNKGIESAKKSGALTICLREHLRKNYLPRGADIYIDDIAGLIRILEVIK